MEYLTVYDLVWINSAVTGKVNPYNYVTLEAAMAGQYSYGQSQDVPTQAANLLERLLTRKSYQSGNRRTALIATLTFLNANGYDTRASDAEAAEIVRAVDVRQTTAPDAIARLAAPAAQPLTGVTLRKLIAHECNAHCDALKLLAEND